MQQSFNSENFIKIFYEENRKGFYVEKYYKIFNPVRNITKTISDINENFKIKVEYKGELKEKANRVKDKLKTRKFNKIKGDF